MESVIKSIRVRRDLLAEVDRICAAEERSRNWFITRSLRDAVRRHKRKQERIAR